MISAPGVGSGLDVNSIVQQLMALERQPLDRLETDRSGLEAQLSAYGKLKSALSDFQTALADLKTVDAFTQYKATSGDESAFTATVNSSAAPGQMSIQVMNLAQAHKLGSLAFTDTDNTTLGGPGDQIVFTVNGESFTVDAGGLTLSGLQNAINTAADNVGVSASIISENSGANYLVLTSDETGTANAVNISFSNADMEAQLGLTTINNAENARILVDNTYTVTRPANVIDDAISGVTLTLEAQTSSAVSLEIDRDVDKVSENVQAFVDSFNELRTTMASLRTNELEADSTLRSIESQLRLVFNTAPSGLTNDFSYLSEVGVSFQKDGSLALDSARLKDIISTDFSQVAELFAHDDQGYLFRMDSVVDSILQNDGLIENREDGINTRIDTVDKRISDMEYRLQLTEQRLLNQFTALDTLIGQLNGTSQYLSQQLSSLPAIGQ
jgi:flagellar hook-associated protein 2